MHPGVSYGHSIQTAWVWLMGCHLLVLNVQLWTTCLRHQGLSFFICKRGIVIIVTSLSDCEAEMSYYVKTLCKSTWSKWEAVLTVTVLQFGLDSSFLRWKCLFANWANHMEVVLGWLWQPLREFKALFDPNILVTLSVFYKGQQCSDFKELDKHTKRLFNK